MAGQHDGYGGHMPSELNTLTEEIRKLNISKGWRVNVTGAREGYEFPAYIALIHSEVSEALEAYRDKVWSATRCTCDPGPELQHHPYCEQKPVGVGPELADVLIRVLDTADIWGIDIEYELRRVLAYGWTRPYQHGGKVL
jgi:NTP pyrophosphatase (non-canonical NTP hydrolase)